MANELDKLLKDAEKNLRLVAEAQVRLAAGGQVSLATFEKNAKAVEFLRKNFDKAAEGAKKTGKEANALGVALKDVGRAATIGFAALSAGAYAFTSAGAPAAMDTFTQSMTLLSAHVGQVFMPVILQAADYIQDLAHWFGSLDDSTKDNIATAIKWGAATLGVVVVITKLAGAFSALWPVVKGTYAIIAAHPFGLLLVVIGAVAGALVGLANAFRTVGRDVREMAESASKYGTIAEKVKGGGRLEIEDVHEVLTGAEEKKIRGAKTPKERDRILEEMLYNEEGKTDILGKPEVRAERAVNLRAQVEEAEAKIRVEREKGPIASRLTAPEVASREATDIARKYFPEYGAKEQGDIGRKIAEGLLDGSKTLKKEVLDAFEEPVKKQAARTEVLETIKAQGLPDEKNKHMRALPRETQAAYTGFAAARQKFQMELLQKSPIEQEIMRLQRQAYQRMIADLPEIREATRGTEKKLPIGAGR